MADKMEFLAKVPLFAGLSDRQKKKLVNRFITREYKAGDYIVTQGKGGAGMFTIVSGAAEAIVESMDGEKTDVNTFGATDFFGEIALLDDGLRTASVIATKNTECMVLSREDFISIMKNDADMGVVIAEELAKRLRRVVGTM
ncbi:MAG: cyclic nucleotide-binding domain-containing protein [Chloroflexi bacterium]|nr:cyclic nucleotide-binding domain-containing protein [Chloroflexota bacterium]